MAHCPMIPLVRFYVEHSQQVGREYRLVRVIDGQLTRQIDAATEPAKMLTESLTSPVLRKRVRVAFRGQRSLGLRGQRYEDRLSLLRAELVPKHLRRRARIQGIDSISGSNPAHALSYYNRRSTACRSFTALLPLERKQYSALVADGEQCLGTEFARSAGELFNEERFGPLGLYRPLRLAELLAEHHQRGAAPDQRAPELSGVWSIELVQAGVDDDIGKAADLHFRGQELRVLQAVRVVLWLGTARVRCAERAEHEHHHRRLGDVGPARDH